VTWEWPEVGQRRPNVGVHVDVHCRVHQEVGCWKWEEKQG
jgi:hypothetical protein